MNPNPYVDPVYHPITPPHTGVLDGRSDLAKLESRIAELEHKIAELEFAMDAMENIHQSKRVHSLYLETD